VVEVNGEQIERYTVTPGDVGLPVADPAAVAGGSAAENAATTRAILTGPAGPDRDLAVLA
jgi:anthranilate phosphoribosyltransferase